MEYWKKQLADAPKALLVPTDRPPPAARTFRRAREELRMPASLVRELHALGRRQNVTPFMTLLGAWATLLHRYSGQDDLLIRTPFANRNRVEVEDLIGSFSNVLVLRHDLSGDPPFAELLRRVRETTVDAFSHGELPFKKLREELDLTVWVAFTLGNTPSSNLKLDGLQIEEIEIPYGGTSPFLTLRMLEGDDGLMARLAYNPDLFEAATAARMLEHLRTLLESVVADPEQRISELPLPAKAERPSAAGIAAAARRRRRPIRFRKRLRRVVRRARKAAIRLRARIKTSPFFR